jgi:hypothetical protein
MNFSMPDFARGSALLGSAKMHVHKMGQYSSEPQGGEARGAFSKYLGSSSSCVSRCEPDRVVATHSHAEKSLGIQQKCHVCTKIVVAFWR